MLSVYLWCLLFLLEIESVFFFSYGELIAKQINKRSICGGGQKGSEDQSEEEIKSELFGVRQAMKDNNNNNYNNNNNSSKWQFLTLAKQKSKRGAVGVMWRRGNCLGKDKQKC